MSFALISNRSPQKLGDSVAPTNACEQAMQELKGCSANTFFTEALSRIRGIERTNDDSIVGSIHSLIRSFARTFEGDLAWFRQRLPVANALRELEVGIWDYYHELSSSLPPARTGVVVSRLPEELIRGAEKAHAAWSKAYMLLEHDRSSREAVILIIAATEAIFAQMLII